MFTAETVRRFIRSEQFGGVLLLACTILSLALANSPFADAWLALWHVSLGPLSLEHWINDALMAVFFLMIGLELERGVKAGALSSLRNASLPAIAGLGGMLVPALIHFALNRGTAAEPGFGIPMATDIAFALAVIAVLGPRIPPTLKLFVVAYAIIDDLGAIVLIATVYTAKISIVWLALALGTWLALMVLKRAFHVMALAPYLLAGVFMWLCVYKAGVHASIAGVMLAFAVPFRGGRAAQSPSLRLERRLHSPVAFLVLPLFALANTCVPIDGRGIAMLVQPNGLGIALGLIVGKPLGILLFCAMGIRSGLCALPDGVRFSHVLGAGLLGGIGFTMSIFITNLAFASEPAMINPSKLAVLTASIVAGVLGWAWLKKGTDLFIPHRVAGPPRHLNK